METKRTDRVDFRATPHEKAVMRKLAELKGKTLTELLCGYIERLAKREGVWDQ